MQSTDIFYTLNWNQSFYLRHAQLATCTTFNKSDSQSLSQNLVDTHLTLDYVTDHSSFAKHSTQRFDHNQRWTTLGVDMWDLLRVSIFALQLARIAFSNARHIPIFAESAVLSQISDHVYVGR